MEEIIFVIIKKLVLNIISDLNKLIIDIDCLKTEIIHAEYNKVFEIL